jgi:TolB-like protein/DNA-binding SARP family transcriptional activator/tetratricopeptide (TPR) repeat protein
MPKRVSLQRHLHRRRASGEPSGRLLLRTLGEASLASAGSSDRPVVVLGPGKLLALLVFLACAPDRRTTANELLDLFWADHDGDSGHHDLRQAVWQLRRRLGRGALTMDRGAVALRGSIQVDRDDFLRAVEDGALERAVDLYRGEFLAGLSAPGAVSFERWADVERYRLQRAFSRAAETLVRDRLSAGRFAAAHQLARRRRDADPHEEGAWALLIEAFLSAGDAARAAAEADLLERVLAADGREPERETRALLQRVRAAARDGAAPVGPTLLAPPLVSREREFHALVRAWDRARCGAGGHIHAAGKPGVGKTRLLREFRARLQAMGGRVLYLRARFAGRRVAFGLASELVAALAELPGSAGISPEAASALVALNPTLSGRFPSPLDTTSGDEALRRRALALLELLGSVSEEQPVAVLCDDVQWIDPPSHDLLQWVFGKLDRLRALCVTTGPETARSPEHATTSERLVVLPLSVDGVGALITSLGALPHARWGRTLVERLHAATDGLPRRVLEVLEKGLEMGWLALGPAGWASQNPHAMARYVSVPPAPGSADLVVLPFVAAAPQEGHWAIGLTEGLISDLSRVSALRVIGYPSALRLQEMADDLASLRAAVNVRYVIQGTVQADGDGLRVTARVRDVATGAVLRDETWSGRRADLFALRERVARAAIQALNVRVSPGEQLGFGGLSNTDVHAYECYLRARQCIWSFAPGELQRALAILQHGLEVTGENALLRATLGTLYWSFVQSGANLDETMLQKAEDCASKALALDPHLSQGHFLAGCVAQMRGRAHDAAGHLRRALSLDPNNADALMMLAYLYAAAGKTFAARALGTRLLEIDPLTGINQVVPGFIAMLEGRFEEAVPAHYRAQKIDRSPPSVLVYAIALARAGHYDEAHQVIDRLRQEMPDAPATLVATFLQRALRGERRQAVEAVTPSVERNARLVEYLAWHVGAGYAMVGETDRAVAWLDHAASMGFVNYPFLLADPLLERIRGEPVFSALAERVKQAWEEFEL